MLRGCQLRNTEFVHGVVLYAGHETKLMQNSTARVSKISNVEKVANYQIVLMFVLEITLAALAAMGSGIWISAAKKDNTTYLGLHDVEPTPYAFSNFFTFFILFNNLIPISLYVSMELVKFGQAYLISSDLTMYHAASDTPAEALTSDLNEELGQIQYVFADKTGTLTENLMAFAGISIDSVMYGSLPSGNKNSRGPQHDLVPLSQLKASLAVRDASSPHWKALLTLALCHTVLPSADASHDEALGETLAGHAEARPSPTEMAASVAGIKYQAESPDEGALVHAARELGCALVDRMPRSMTVAMARGRSGSGPSFVEYELLHVLEFTSARKRMSVIVRNSAGSILLLTKGADTVILPALAETSKASPALLAGLVHIEMFAEAGLRTLMCAVRELERETYEAWKAEHFDPAARALEHRDDKLAAAAAIIETELEYVCVTAIEDKLQEGVSDTISLLRKAGINVWVLTGDKQGTAINIAMSCELLTPAMQLHVANEDTAEATVARLVALEKLVPVESEQEQAFVIDGHTLFHALEDKVGAATFEEVSTRCRAVIVCRATPLQKASVVKMVRVRKPPGGGPRALTLAIGDGSNDVSMIQAAHVGVGISGREGLQAARAADYAIAQFRYLAVLLLKHGAWSYQRTTMVINYSFYKNIALYLIQLWFAFFNGLSGQTLFERWTISLFNVLFTSLPILVHGLYNAEFSASTQLLFPELYWAGRNRELFNTKVFWSWCANAVFHSLVLYFL
ncbi:uncharacterized protein AMSG_02984 [Thecamonas trahens ATCC 50062]|uniref:Phospholipid-transporting ATPase n=1 Tax=Thecamonas trahens ATCC 50062 TaxID=461836 RepID=A0A0L0D2K0_THETB|nr:hypothetical protein AMSG_02984 [Thecamonas trahens ATCC 50062]KNC46549.1 hypothetical protein AMSG_02984 [Thecamonas trahens ATCC 50062]|eukprot:XP_013760328.1 hypothetical protein AMSG_02984 [Thecamonas trahens ATCC 50062]